MAKKRNSNEQYVRDFALMHDNAAYVPVATGVENPLPVELSGNTISTLNSTSVVLGPGEIFQGVGEDVSKHGRAGISVWTPFGEKTNGTLTIEVSRDGVNYGGPSRAILDTTTAQPVMWEIVEQYFRIKYENGPDTASQFVIQTQYSNNGAIFLGQQFGDSLSDTITGIATIGSIQGKDRDGIYRSVAVDNAGALRVSDGEDSGQELLRGILWQLRVLNARFEEAFQTGIRDEDLENEFY